MYNLLNNCLSLNINLKTKNMTTIKMYELKYNETNYERVKIITSEDAANYIKLFYHDDINIYESSFLLLLNRSNMTIGFAKISQGGIAGTVIDVKIIMKYAIESLASAFILAHNHPSGNIKPSDTDIKTTKSITTICKLMDTHFLDHLILTKNDYYSLADNGDM